MALTGFEILQAVIEATPDAIFVKDLEGRYLVVNHAAARFLGRPPADILGKSDIELYPAATAQQFIDDDRKVREAGTALSFEGVAESSGGRQAYLVTKGVFRDRDGRILGTYGISHDMTELQHARESLEQTREALFRSQKMEAVGQLTGGIAHDFNNILSVIMGNVDLLRLHLSRGSEQRVREVADAIQRAATLGKDLVTQLLSFAGRRQLNPQQVEIDRMVDSLVNMIERTINSGIRVEKITGGARTVFVDPSALEAAVLNVAINARDAMPNGGVLTIRTSQVVINDASRTQDQPAPGTYALVQVEDTGCGMTADVAARAFEPFFTTKSNQGGTGLGLSMVYGFAHQSGGAVTIQSVPGCGTTINIYLPAL